MIWTPFEMGRVVRRSRPSRDSMGRSMRFSGGLSRTPVYLPACTGSPLFQVVSTATPPHASAMPDSPGLDRVSRRLRGPDCS